MAGEKFMSARDVFTQFIVWVCLFFIVLISAVAIFTGDKVIGIILLLIGITLMWPMFATYYVFTSDTLRIRSGPFRWSILVRDIKSVRRTTNPISSPALSKKRLEIVHKDGQILVSPKREDDFLATIRKANPKVRIDV